VRVEERETTPMSAQLLHDRERKRKQKIPALYHPGDRHTRRGSHFRFATQKRARQKRGGLKRKPPRNDEKKERNNRTHQELEQVIAVRERVRERERETSGQCVLH
jgi:hypothetical protein